MTAEPRFLLIGLGHIGRYVYPCYSSVLGPRLGRDMLAVKAGAAGLEELQARYPFPIRGDGDCAAAARDIRPDVILIACRPPQVRPIVEQQLKPYFDLCRAQGRTLPLLISYAPAPRVTWFRDCLGEGVLAANVIPNMEHYTAGVCTASITHNLVTLDHRAAWPEDGLAFLRRYLAPQGLYLPCRVEESLPLLSAKVISHRLYDSCLLLAEGFGAAGREVGHDQVAEAGRAYLRSWPEDFPPDVRPCSGHRLPRSLRPMVERTLRAWYDGIMEVCLAHGVRRDIGGSFLRGMFDLNLLTVSLSDREGLARNIRHHSTPGGLQERSCLDFAAAGAEELREAARRFAAGESDPDFPGRWRQRVARLNEGLIDFGRDMDKGRNEN